LTSFSRIVSAASLIMLGSVLSRVMGLVREMVIAAYFGTSAATSAFVTASTVPTMAYDLLVGGAVSAALIPVFSEYIGRGDEDSLWAVASSLLTLAALALSLVVLVAVLLAPQLIWLLGVGFAPGVEGQALLLTRIILPSLFFLGLAGITSALLYARQSFIYPALSLCAYNVGIVLGAVLLAHTWGVASLAAGALLGAALQLGLQWLGMGGARLTLRIDWRHPGLRRMLKLYLPVALGLVVSQAGIIVDRNLAWRTGSESLAIMRFATTLVQFPLGLVASATSLAVLPSLSQAAARAAMRVGKPTTSEPSENEGEEPLHEYKETLILGLNLALLLIIPATVGLVLVRAPVVQLLFQQGVFDERASALTALAFLCYAPQMPFVAVDQLLIFAFYARQNTVVPVLVGVVAVCCYLLAGLSLIGRFGVLGLILANTVQNSLHAVILYLLLRHLVGGLRERAVLSTILRALLAAAAMALAYLAVSPAIEPLLSLGKPGLALYVLVAAGVGGLAYLLCIWRLGVREANLLGKVIMARLRPA